MIFFDYDGVLGNTEIGLFDEYERLKKIRPELTHVAYLRAMDWGSWLRKAGPKKDAFTTLKSYDPSVAAILTRCWSTMEAIEKICYIRENGVQNPIIIVPGGLKKTELVCPKGHLLVEDQLGNAKDWLERGGAALMLDQGPFEECPTIHSIEEAFIYAKEYGYI